MKDINNKFLSLALKWLYFYDGELFQLSKNSDGQLVRVNAKTTASVPVLVVTRNYYQEKLQEYPVDNTKELKKVLALELASEVRSTRFIWGQRQSKSILYRCLKSGLNLKATYLRRAFMINIEPN